MKVVCEVEIPDEKDPIKAVRRAVEKYKLHIKSNFFKVIDDNGLEYGVDMDIFNSPFICPRCGSLPFIDDFGKREKFQEWEYWGKLCDHCIMELECMPDEEYVQEMAEVLDSHRINRNDENAKSRTKENNNNKNEKELVFEVRIRNALD